MRRDRFRLPAEPSLGCVVSAGGTRLLARCVDLRSAGLCVCAFRVRLLSRFPGMDLRHADCGGRIPPWQFPLGHPAVLLCAVFWTIALMAVCGKVVVTVNGNEGTVFVGIGPLGWTRSFDWSAVTVIRQEGACSPLPRRRQRGHSAEGHHAAELRNESDRETQILPAQCTHVSEVRRRRELHLRNDPIQETRGANPCSGP